MFSENYQQPVI